MSKVPKPLIIGGALLGVLLVGGGGFLLWRQRQPAEVSEEPRPERQLPVTPPSAEEMSYEAFTTADGHLSLEYPAAWTRTEIQNLETVLPENFIDKYELTMPLILSDPRGAQTTLSIYQFEKGISLGAAMEAFKADLTAMGQSYNEVGRETVGEMMVVDSAVDAGQGVVVKVRDLLFLVPGEVKDAVYNISFSARQDSWGECEPIFSHIQDSARLSL